MMNVSIQTLAAMGVALLSCLVASADPCDPQWFYGDPRPGVSGTPNCTVGWDPDGDGPLPELLVVAGENVAPAGITNGNIAAWDPVDLRWKSFGTGTNGPIEAIEVLHNHRLVIVGNFTQAGGIPVNGIAVWDGEAWSALGSGTGPNRLPILGVHEHSDGSIYVTGTFTTFNGIPAGGIARWSGGTWDSPGGGVTNGRFRPMLELANGDLLVGGQFQLSTPNLVGGVVRWDGQTWTEMSGGAGDIFDLVEFNGQLIASGCIRGDSPTCSFSGTWNGTQWVPFPTSYSQSRNDLLIHNGQLFISEIKGALVWDGSAWSRFGAELNGKFYSLCTFNGRLIGAGPFSLASQNQVLGVVQFDNEWVPIEPWISEYIDDVEVLPDGSVLFSGDFDYAGSRPNHENVRWQNGTWISFGGEFEKGIRFTYVDDDGRLYVISDTRSGPEIFQWIPETQTWHSFGVLTHPISFGYPDAWVTDMVFDPRFGLTVAGEFTAAGSTYAFRVANWDGTSWSPFGYGISGTVESLCRASSGELYAAGAFGYADGWRCTNIARWDGTRWNPIGVGVGTEVRSIVEGSDGTIYIGGSFTTAGGVPLRGLARLNGTQWEPLPPGLSNGSITKILRIEDGRLLITGGPTITGSSTPVGVAIWDGVELRPVPGAPRSVLSAARYPNDEFVVVGNMFLEQGGPRFYYARYTPHGIPNFARQPESIDVAPGEDVVLTIGVLYGYDNVSIQWYRDGDLVSDGPGGASSEGGIVAGSFATLPSPTQKHELYELRITAAGPSDSGNYTVVATNSCGSTMSRSVRVSVCPPCAADFDFDGGVTPSDVAAFLLAWEVGATCADVNTDGGVDASDLASFFSVFEAGGC